MSRILISTLLLWLALSAAALADASISVEDLRFPSPRKQEYRDGEATLSRQPVYWESDAPWLVTLEALDGDLGRSDDGEWVKPLADLQFRLSKSRNWYALSQFPQEVERGTAGRGSFNMDWRVLLDIEKDRPGRYRADLLFTISEL